MKKVLYILFLVFCSSIITNAQPKLEIIGGDTYNWGQIKENQNPLKAKVQLKNAGTEKLIINEVKPTCGCTTAPLDKSELAPGEIATLDVTLKVSGSGNEITKNIKISSNDKNNPSKVLWLKASIIRELQILPHNYFNFNEMTIGYPKEDKITLKNNSKEVIKLTNFVIDPPELQLNLKGTVQIKPGQQIDMVAKFTPKASGNFRGTVKFKTTNDDNKEVSMSVFGRIKESPIFNNAK